VPLKICRRETGLRRRYICGVRYSCRKTALATSPAFSDHIDLEGWKGDYPGVCKYSERKKYLSNCPDSDFILNMNKFI